MRSASNTEEVVQNAHAVRDGAYDKIFPGAVAAVPRAVNYELGKEIPDYERFHKDSVNGFPGVLGGCD